MSRPVLMCRGVTWTGTEIACRAGASPGLETGIKAQGKRRGSGSTSNYNLTLCGMTIESQTWRPFIRNGYQRASTNQFTMNMGAKKSTPTAWSGAV